MTNQFPKRNALRTGAFAASALLLLASAPLSTAMAKGSAAQGGATQTNAADSAPGTMEMMAAMVGMKPATDMMKMTGDVDRDFMIMMITHHNAGIAMSTAEQGYGQKEELKEMATSDIRDQMKDNREMREYLQHPAKADKGPGSNSAASTAMMDAMTKMNQSMTGMKLNGKQDHDFIMMMIPHHEAAIAMAQVEVQHGSDPRAKKVAEGVIKSQSKDVKDMKTWHKAWFNSDYPM